MNFDMLHDQTNSSPPLRVVCAGVREGARVLPQLAPIPAFPRKRGKVSGGHISIIHRNLCVTLPGSIGGGSYKAIPPAIMDVIAGQVQSVCADPSSLLPHIRTGRLCAIGVSTAKRVAAMPDIPTIAEAGVPGFEVASMSGFVLPAHAARHRFAA